MYSAIGYWALFQGGKTPVLIASTEDLRHWQVEGRAVASTAYQLSMRFAVTDTSFLMASQDLTEQHLLLVCRSRQ